MRLLLLALLLLGAAPAGAAEWYIDSTAGDTANDGLGAGTPKKYLSHVFAGRDRPVSSLSAGDTVHLAAGTYTETFAIDTDYIRVLGADSATTIISYGDSGSGARARGIFADTQTGLLLTGLQVANCYEGVHWDGVTGSRIDDVLVRSCGREGIYWDNVDTSSIDSTRVEYCNPGIYLEWCDSNVISASAYANAANGFDAWDCNSNLFLNCTAESNTYGFSIGDCDSNTFTGGTVSRSYVEGFVMYGGCDTNLVTTMLFRNNGWTGLQAFGPGSANVFADNISRQNYGGGIELYCDGNTVQRNLVQNNFGSGLSLSQADNNFVLQNTFDSNAGYAVSLNLSSADTFVKNIFIPCPGTDSLVTSSADTPFAFYRNYWGTTDSSIIAGGMRGTGAGLIAWQPYRLGTIDTAAGADTIAPAAPATLNIAADTVSRSCTLSWSAATTNEEIGGALSDLQGYRIYRSRDADTGWWEQVGSTATTTWSDSGLQTTTYYYRVTAYDNHAPWANESWYSDSCAAAVLAPDTSGPNIWYIDALSGDTANDGLSPGTAKKYLSSVFTGTLSPSALLTEGDTVFLAAGTYSETIAIDTDYIAVIGAGWATTIIDPGDSSNARVTGLFADTQTGLLLREFQVTGSKYGIQWKGVNNSRIDTVHCRYNGSYGMTMCGSGNNTFYLVNCYNDLGGFDLWDCANNYLVDCVFDTNDGFGLILGACDSNTVLGGSANANTGGGLWMYGNNTNNLVGSFTCNNNGGNGFDLDNSHSNTVVDGTSSGNGLDGYWISVSHHNTFLRNVACNNAAIGMELWRSNSNRFSLNTCDSNASYQVYLAQSTADTFDKNIFLGGDLNPDSAVSYNESDSAYAMYRNYWGSTDSEIISGAIRGSGAGLIAWQPYRLGMIDTAAGADTIAPAAPATLNIAADTVSRSCTLSWSAATTNEEIGGALTDLQGYRIYRSRDADTGWWEQVGSTATTTWSDSGLQTTTYYYRVTAYDNHAPWANESWYSDSLATADLAPDTSGPNAWYINSTAGDTGNDGLSALTPKKYLSQVLAGRNRPVSLLTAGDTVHIAAGTYSETIAIDADTVWIIGEDSAGVLLDYGDSSAVADRAGISATGRTGLVLRSLGITNIHDAIRWREVTRSRIEDCRLTHCGNSGGGSGINFTSSCTEVVISGNYVFETGNGITIWRSYNITVTGNLLDDNDLNGLYIGYSDSCTVTGNTSSNNSSYGFEIHNLAHDAYVAGNRALRNGGSGFYSDISDRHRYIGNSSTDNGVFGFEFYTCNATILQRNTCSNNRDTGIYLWHSDNVRLTGNDIDSNAGYALVLEECGSCTVVKNNIVAGTLFPGYGIHVASGDTPVDGSRNYWGTTDSAAVAGLVHGAGATAVTLTPFRLGRIDTAAGADTIAPAAPATLLAVADTVNAGCTLAWPASASSEEIGGGAPGDLQGYRIYRSRTGDTGYWGTPLADTTATTYYDAGLDPTRYYYRVTAYDNHAPWENESWYSDSLAGIDLTPDTSGANAWYVNGATGDTANNGLAPATAKKYLRQVFAGRDGTFTLLSQGDTVHIAAGTYDDTIAIDTDDITVAGAGWATTIIRYGDTGNTVMAAGIYADSQSGLQLRDLQITGVFDGIYWYNVDNSRIADVRVATNGNNGMYLRDCDTNSISLEILNNAWYGVYMWNCDANSFQDNICSGNWLNGFEVIDCDSFTLTNYTVTGNLDEGINLYFSDSCLVANNTCAGNTANGIMIDSCRNGQFTANTVSQNRGGGISLINSHENRFRHNSLLNNFNEGFWLLGSNSNLFAQNTCDSNADYAVLLQNSSADTFEKNNFAASPGHPDSGILSVNSDSAYLFRRNYWGTANYSAILAVMQGAGADSLHWQPYRLGMVDTAAGADTIAPAAPATLDIVADTVSRSCTLSWSAATTNEEIGGGLSDLQGYRVYRDTSPTAYTWTLIGSTAGTTFSDSGLAAGDTFYYRVTAYDNHAPRENESWYSDSVVQIPTAAKPGDFVQLGTSAHVVDLADLAYLNAQVALYWGMAPADSRVDLSGDGILDFDDIALFALYLGG